MRTHCLQEAALRYFIAVADTGSLTEASARQHVAASALSRQIAALEAQLGVALFERHPRGMVLTAAGEILLAHARRAELDARAALEDIGALQGLRAGLVRLATSDAFANELVPSLCVDFQRQHQGVGFDVMVMPTAEVPEQVRHGVADIGLCFSRAPHKDIAVLYRQPAPVLALMLPDHPLAARDSVTLMQMADWPLALPPAATTIRQMIDIVCSRQGLQLSPQLVSNHARLMLRFVLNGGGLSVSSEISARHLLARGAIVARPIADAGMDMRDIEVQALAGRGLPVAVQAFLDLLRVRLVGPA
ncbi:LysR family transcriptional regulator [Piscinibacter sakaiensis]|uniref:LysR family transcriptional regulator n=1 Tax=Piscinibacter sakaiensis TaxID=1547922 RepID=UPI003AB0374B